MGRRPEEMEAFNRRMGESWGDNAGLLKLWAPTVADDPGAQELWNRTMVFGGTPATAVAWLEMVDDTDVRATLPAISVPTLVLHRVDDRIVPVQHARYLAEHIPGARYVELPGADHLWWVDGDDILDEVESFLTGARPPPSRDRVLATVMFTDIVDSTDAGRRAGRPPLARARRVARPAGAQPARALPRPRGEDARATASSPPSTAPAARSGAPPTCATPCARSASRCAPASTPARSS